jgi:hypothetical protein
MNRNMARSYNRKLAGDGGSYVIDTRKRSESCGPGPTDFTAGQSFGE